MFSIVLLGIVSWLTGFLVGLCGVGGILVIPALVFLGGLEIHQATATALFTFIFLGALGVWLFWRKGSIVWGIAVPVCVGAIPFSVAGSIVNSLLGSAHLNLFVALVIVLAGAYMLVPMRERNGYLDGKSRKQKAWLVAIGAVSGFGSGLSGAGGPVFSVPMMLIIGFEPIVSIGASQVLVLISSGAATAVNVKYGSIDVVLGGWVAVMELAGVVIGVNVGHDLRVRRHLRFVVAILCIAIGTLMLAASGKGTG